MKVAPIVLAKSTPPANHHASDHLRHRAAPGARTRDSLFWQCVMPEEKIGFQAYLYMTSDGKAGFNAVVMSPERRPLAIERIEGVIPESADFDDFAFEGLALTQSADGERASLRVRGETMSLEYAFEGLHPPFSYHQNPDGLPSWFAVNRFEQTGRARGSLTFGDRRIVFDRIGHRDHSWGLRQWTMPQHWKWLIAYTPDASRIVNAWIWIARGEWGVGGYVVRDGVLTAIAHVRQRAQYDDDMTQRGAEIDIVDVDGAPCALRLERFGLAKLPAGGKYPTMIMEAACTAEIDGRSGAGQFETQWPQDYLDRLKELRGRE